MSKAILVMDMPKSCNDCILIDEPYDSCVPMDRDVSDYRNETKPTWCPLREVPQKKEVCGKYPQADKIPASYKIGYNAAIDEILGKGGV